MTQAEAVEKTCWEYFWKGYIVQDFDSWWGFRYTRKHSGCTVENAIYDLYDIKLIKWDEFEITCKHVSAQVSEIPLIKALC